MYVCLYLELWGQYSSKEGELSGEVGFKGKDGHDFVVRRTSGMLTREQNITNDGGGGGFKRERVEEVELQQGLKHTPVETGAEESG